MKPQFETTYLGELRCENLHLQSGTKIITDAPTDNLGRGEAFSPTDLCALSLTTCIITTMGIYAQQKEFEIRSISASTQKIMAADPRRIVEIVSMIKISLGDVNSERQQEGLRRIAHTCPVARSLHPDIQQNVTIVFE